MTDEKAEKAGTFRRALLFADIVGSTSLIGEIGDLSAREIIGKFMDAAQAAASRHNATIDKFFGDGFLALFEDVEHALAFARDVHQAQSAIVTTAGPLRVRYSIHMGDVDVVRTSYGMEVTGEPLVVAARLNSITPPDSVAISRAAAQQLPVARRATLRFSTQRLKGLPIEFCVLDLAVS